MMIKKQRDKDYFTIGEVAKEANVSASSIRHWEKEGLISPNVTKRVDFVYIAHLILRRIFIIRTVQRVAYSLDIVREVLSDIDKNNIVRTKEMALQSLQYIDNVLVEQIRGIASLQNLLDFVSK